MTRKSERNSLIVTIFMILFVVAIMLWQASQDNACSERGGTYLWREGKCLDVRTK